MKKDADAHAAEDRKRKEEVETKNQADNLVFQTRKQLKDLGDKIDSDLKAKVEKAADDLDAAIKAGTSGEIKAKTEALNNAWNEASSKMYEHMKNQPGAGAPDGGQAPPMGEQPAGEPKQEKGKAVEDADFEVVDDKDK
jgi:molecular chaperone DnaK